MRVLDLFAGLRGWSDAFANRGHEVITLDADARFGSTITADVLTWTPDPDLDVDVILASPPCEGFSVMTLGRSWTVPYPGTRYVHLRAQTEPKSETARLGLALVERTRELIAELSPRFAVIENPRGKLRKLGVLSDLERRTVTYCAYTPTVDGVLPNMKPTDLWGAPFPPSLVLRPACRNGDPCHAPSPRGSHDSGIQSDIARAGANGSAKRREVTASRARVPDALALAVCLAAEHDLGVERDAADDLRPLRLFD